MTPPNFRLARSSEIQAVRAFFALHLISAGDAVPNPEYACPDGIQAAIMRGQMMLATGAGGTIFAAARFYRKRSGEVSLYQFALAPAARGTGLARGLFDAIRAGSPMVAQCPTPSAFNRYFQKTGWKASTYDEILTRWVLE